MKRIIFLLRVVALTLVLLAISVVPASGTNTAKYCNYGYHPPAAEAENYSGSP